MPHAVTGGTGAAAGLRIEGLSLRFGGQEVLQSVSFPIEAGSICGLVGPNGAGKTSLFNCITGSYSPEAGSAWLNLPDRPAIDLTRVKPHRLAALGVARTFQHPILDPAATVLENTLCGAHVRSRDNPLAIALGLPSVRRGEAALHRAARDIIDALGLSYWAGVAAGSLPYGTQKMVELARALLSEPHLLLLDEPAGGLPQDEVDALEALLRRLRTTFQLTILFVEHHMGLVSRLSDKVVALVGGRFIVAGPVALVKQHPAVVEGYLGVAG
jgi:branched-chain amino acid transport system ATP-binding protein